VEGRLHASRADMADISDPEHIGHLIRLQLQILITRSHLLFHGLMRFICGVAAAVDAILS
jgi:hypothetical protein